MKKIRGGTNENTDSEADLFDSEVVQQWTAEMHWRSEIFMLNICR